MQASLERGVAVCCNTAESNLLMFETETISMAMGLLTAVMAGAIEVLVICSWDVDHISRYFLIK